MEPLGTLTGIPAAVVVWGLHVALPVAMMAIASGRAIAQRARAKAADAREDASAPLVEGEAVLDGRVELAPGRDVAVRVEITQEGTERRHKGEWSHSYEEVARRVIHHPFYVHDRRGARVRVEPDASVMIVDDLDDIAYESRTRRTRIAEVSNDEDVYVIGELVRAPDPDAGGYREATTALVLRPPRRGRLLVSAQPLGLRFRRAARGQLLAALLFGALAAGLGLVDLPYHMRLWYGVREDAVVIDTSARRGKNERCVIEVEARDGARCRDDLPLGYCDVVSRDALFPLVRLPGSDSFCQLGARAGVGSILAIIGALLTLVVAFVYLFAPNKPWWESKLVDRGGGRLPDPPSVHGG